MVSCEILKIFREKIKYMTRFLCFNVILNIEGEDNFGIWNIPKALFRFDERH